MSRLVGLFALLVLSPRPAHAAGDQFFWEAFNLILLLGVLFYFARKPVMNYLAERRDGIQKNIESSEQLLSEAQTRLVEWSEKAAQLDAEVQGIRQAAHRSAEQEKAKIIADAEVTAERIRQNASVVAERELHLARERLRDEAADLAMELAARILREQVADADRDRLVDEFISDIESGGSN